MTLSIPLAGGTELTPPARRLLDVVRELVEHGGGRLDTTVAGAVGQAPVPPVSAVPEPAVPASRTCEGGPPGTHRRAAPESGTGLRILVTSRLVCFAGVPLALTRLEFDLLLHLASHPRRVFTRLQLLAAVWGYEHTGVRTVDVHIRRLRSKVGPDMPLVTTVYGVGYRLAEDARITIDRSG